MKNQEKREKILHEINELSKKLEPLSKTVPLRNNAGVIPISWGRLNEAYESSQQIRKLEKELFDLGGK